MHLDKMLRYLRGETLETCSGCELLPQDRTGERALHRDPSCRGGRGSMTGEPLRLSPDAYPSLLPGLLAEGEAIHFGRFREMLVGKAEVAFAMDCDGVTPYARLLDRHPDAECVAACLPYLVWWDRPLATVPAMPVRAAGERWLLVSPHPDDVELSMGGLVLNHRDDRALRHLICFTHLLYTQYSEAFPTDCEATALRKDEASLSSPAAGRRHPHAGPAGIPGAQRPRRR